MILSTTLWSRSTLCDGCSGKLAHDLGLAEGGAALEDSLARGAACTIVPPFANAAYAVGELQRGDEHVALADREVHRVTREPDLASTRSGLPALSACLNVRSGMRPLASPGRPMPVACPKPNRWATRWMPYCGAFRSVFDSSRSAEVLPVQEADVVEEHVARHGERAVEVDDAVGLRPRVLRTAPRSPGEPNLMKPWS